MYQGVSNDKTYGMQIYFYSCALVVTLLMQQPIYAGSFSLNGSTTCEACQPGTFSNVGASLCLECPSGYR